MDEYYKQKFEEYFDSYFINKFVFDYEYDKDLCDNYINVFFVPKGKRFLCCPPKFFEDANSI